MWGGQFIGRREGEGEVVGSGGGGGGFGVCVFRCGGFWGLVTFVFPPE